MDIDGKTKLISMGIGGVDTLILVTHCRMPFPTYITHNMPTMQSSHYTQSSLL